LLCSTYKNDILSRIVGNACNSGFSIPGALETLTPLSRSRYRQKSAAVCFCASDPVCQSFAEQLGIGHGQQAAERDGLYCHFAGFLMVGGTVAFGSFLAEYTIAQDNSLLSTSELYVHYSGWAKDNGYRPLNSKNFVGELRRRYVVRHDGRKGNVVENMALSLNPLPPVC
jgi:hypothetical protein